MIFIVVFFLLFTKGFSIFDTTFSFKHKIRNKLTHVDLITYQVYKTEMFSLCKYENNTKMFAMPMNFSSVYISMVQSK